MWNVEGTMSMIAHVLVLFLVYMEGNESEEVKVNGV